MATAKFIGIMLTDEELTELRDTLDVCIQRHPLGDNGSVEIELLERLYDALGRAR